MLFCIRSTMLSHAQGTKAVQFARQIVQEYVQNKNHTQSEFDNIFHDKQGVFVTLHTYPNHELRGCIGIPLPMLSLHDALIEAAQSVTRDPRFPPLEATELDGIIVEVTVLTPPKLIKVSAPQEYLSQVVIGRDGLIVEQGFCKGLLLPQVPVEQGWDIEEYLSHTCMKAGLPPDAWFEKTTKISKFQGQIFSETMPHGSIKETHLDGSDC
jgi:uncharacterized protein (TIGR00296 family)